MDDRYESIFEDMKKIEESVEYLIEKNAVSFSSSIFEAMKSQGLSQKELARRMRVSGSYVSQSLNGKMNMTLETMGKITHALGLTFDLVVSDPIVERNTLHESSGEVVNTNSVVVSLPSINDLTTFDSSVDWITHHGTIATSLSLVRDEKLGA